MKIKKRKVAPPPRRDALTTDSLVCKILMRTPLNLDAGGGGAAHGGRKRQGRGGGRTRKEKGSCGGRERGREVVGKSKGSKIVLKEGYAR